MMRAAAAASRNDRDAVRAAAAALQTVVPPERGIVMATFVRSDRADESPFATNDALRAADFAPATAHAFRMDHGALSVVYDIRRSMLSDELRFVPYSRHECAPLELSSSVEIFFGSLPIGYDPAVIASTLSDATGVTISPFLTSFRSETAATFWVAKDKAQHVIGMLHHSAVFGLTELCICNAGAHSKTASRFYRSLRERDDLLHKLLTAAGRNPRRKPMRPLVVCFPEDR